MKLSSIEYYSDFVAYPILILLLAAFGLSGATAAQAAQWLTLCSGAVAAWTLIEYALHRFVFHHLPVLQEMHHEHHVHETASTGTPIWASLAALIGFVSLPLWFVGGPMITSAVTAGLMTGYLWYVSTHHAIHHWHPANGSHLYALKRRHAPHHHIDGDVNFGVTTGFWDPVFRTDLPRLQPVVGALNEDIRSP